MEPVVLWREPAWASALRVGIRLLVALGWLALGLLAPWAWLLPLLWLFALVALAHAALAVANRIKNGGVMLRLMGSGAIEWSPSIQEQWMKRPIDFVDGSRIEVIVEQPIPVPAPAAPHVTLKGATHQISRLPLYRRSVTDFLERLNSLTAERGIRWVEEGDGRKPRESQATSDS
jgi:hypothetical protein